MWRVIALGLAVAVGVAAASVWIANTRFDRRVDWRIEALLDQGVSNGAVIRSDDLAELPEPVRQWLIESGVVGQSIPRTVRLKQEGEIRLGPDKPWMPFRADQYYTIDPVAFLWRVSATAVPGIFVRGVDSLQAGHGRMQMMPLALFSVVNASGPSLDQGTALRYLQEIVWFPHAALSSAISWESIDAQSARATLTLDTITVSGTFFFDGNGRVNDFQALRYRDEETLQLWRTPIASYAEHHGVVVPVAGEGIWGASEDSYTYIHVRILALEYDTAQVYP